MRLGEPMNQRERQFLADYQTKLNLLRSCLEVMEMKTRFLMTNDLVGLEESLTQEAALLEQLMKLDFPQPSPEALAENQEFEEAWLSLRSEIENVMRDIKFVKSTNATLIENGLQFAATLFDAICPPQTYQPSAQVSKRPVEATFRVEY